MINLDKLIFYGSLSKAQEVKEKLGDMENFQIELSNMGGNLIARYAQNGGLVIYPEEENPIVIISLPEKASKVVIGQEKGVIKFVYNKELYYIYKDRDTFHKNL